MTSQGTPQPQDESGERGTERLGGIVRRVLARDTSAEERLEQILAERRRELAEQAAIVEQTLEDLERREARLRDSRTSIERLLRLGQRDLDLRESDLVRLGRELGEREARIEHEVDELTRRKVELGAVELKRAALEQRERARAAREAELDEREAARSEDERDALDGASPDSGSEAPWLLFVPGSSYRLVETVRTPPRAGDRVEVDGSEYVVSKVGPSPLAADGRRCAYLVRGGPVRPAPGGSS
jgi:hypothetical protein